MSDNSHFFDSQTLSSRIKASIVSEYFPQYCRIISKFHTPEMIGFFDMFSGPGVYKNGQLSTPILVGQRCQEDSQLANLVWFVFNDMKYGKDIEDNFTSFFPIGTFKHRPFFADRTFGENERINKFLTKNTYKNRRNERPSVLFIDPWGYKHINTPILADFLKSWGNELFIFINTKRLNADFEKDISQNNLQIIFPRTYDKLKAEKRLQGSVEQRHKFIVDHLGKEFEIILGKRIYTAAFQFMEEDQTTPSHYLLHITKDAKGYELIKQVFDRYANVHRTFNSNHITYTFDPKKMPPLELFDEQFKQENIDFLKIQIKRDFNGQTISALQLFKIHQKDSMYAERHYRIALRQLANNGELEVCYTDHGNHKVSVILNDCCILKFL